MVFRKPSLYQQFYDSKKSKLLLKCLLASSIVAWLILFQTTLYSTPTGSATSRSANAPTQPRLDPNPSFYKACRAPLYPDELPDLESVHTWTSTKKLPKQSITIVTGLSTERLPQLRRQCKVWKDRIAAVLYVPVVNGVAAFNGTEIDHNALFVRVDAFHNELDHEAGCALDLELVYEYLPSYEDIRYDFYPVNAVRNRALRLATTDAVFLLDVDFIPSKDLALSYRHKQDVYDQLLSILHIEGKSIVIPAFGAAGPLAKDDGAGAQSIAEKAPKEHLRLELNLGFVNTFQSQHRQTNYSLWWKSDDYYPVTFKRLYEPYIIIARRYVPFYDERFRGYGHNKQLHLVQTIESGGVDLIVHPTAFVIHQPHAKQRALQHNWLGIASPMLHEAYGDMSRAGFIPVVSFAGDEEICGKSWSHKEYVHMQQAAEKKQAEDIMAVLSGQEVG